MPVITGRRTEELSVLDLIPRLTAVLDRAEHHMGDSVEHHCEARAAADHYVLGLYAEHLCKELFALGDTVKNTVVADIHTVLADKIGVFVEDAQHSVGDIKLLLAGLSPRHIQVEPLGFYFLVFLLQRLILAFELLSTAVHIVHHYSPLEI